MIRQHPFFSPLGCLSSLVILVGIVIAVVVSGGAIFSPGLLTAKSESGVTINGFSSHADFENDCEQCHTPIIGIEAARCENCHASVAEQRAKGAGLHSRFTNVTHCGGCHADHKGRNFNPTDMALVNFDHAASGFSLASHARNYDDSPIECGACHTGAAFAFSDTACADCHGAHDFAFMVDHAAKFGGDCISCHDGAGNLANFDHSRVFPLDGQHAEIDCEACHVNKQFKDTPRECVTCHAEPQIHAGVFGLDCAACHSTAAWTPAALKNHAFPLDHGEGGEVACAVCHPNTYTEYTCYGCHEHTPQNISGEHTEEGITGSRLENCTECHPTGREHEGGD
ncbi:MAG: hypothetical protein FJ030_14470 [Chloroflexi bacterium]|nr:hypothetical protein [Chloroflexota bacterium]